MPRCSAVVEVFTLGLLLALSSVGAAEAHTSPLGEPNGLSLAAERAMLPQVLSPSLAVSKSGNPNPVAVGALLTYTITVTNTGTGNLTGVTLTDPLPAGLTFVSVVSSQGSCPTTPPTVTCDLGSVSSTATVTIVTQTTPAVAGALLTNTATVTSNNAGTQMASTTTQVLAPTPTATATPTASSTATSTRTPTATLTPTSTATFTSTPTFTPTATRTPTPIPPTPVSSFCQNQVNTGGASAPVTACITLYNFTSTVLTETDFHNDSRCPDTIQSPQQFIAAGGMDSYATTTDCPFTGTYGTVIYTLPGGAQLMIKWGNPYSDPNWYHRQVPSGYNLTLVGGHDVSGTVIATPVFTLTEAPGAALATTTELFLPSGQRILAPVPGPLPTETPTVALGIVPNTNPPPVTGAGQPACDSPDDILTLSGAVTGTGGNCGSFSLTVNATGPVDAVVGSTPRVFVPVVHLNSGATAVRSFPCSQPVPPARTVTCTVAATSPGEVPMQRAMVTVRFQTPTGTADLAGTIAGPGGALRGTAALLPPPPPILLPPLPPPVVALPGPGPAGQAPPPITAVEVPVIPEAESLGLLGGGLLLLGGLLALQRWRQTDEPG